MRNLWFPTATVIILVSLVPRISSEGRFGDGEPITAPHLEALAKFKPSAMEVVYLDYQKKDAFLLNWLRASDFDLEKAKTRLVKSMDWRKELQIDSISDNPEIQRFKKMYKHTVDGVDKQGRRILEFNPGRMDARKAILSGKGKAFQLFWYYLFEVGMNSIWNTGPGVGKNVTEFVLLMDATGFSLRTHACFACLGVLASVITDMENNYSGFYYPFIVANAPRGFDVILDFIKPLISSSTSRAMVVLTTDHYAMKKYMDTIIDENQLGKQYGGTRSMIRT